MGSQKRRPADKKDAFSTMCQVLDDSPNWNRVGIYQAITAAVPASQQKTGLLRKCPSNGGILPQRSRITCVNHFGNPHNNGMAGAPDRINGAPTVINRRCFIMWTVSN